MWWVSHGVVGARDRAMLACLALVSVLFFVQSCLAVVDADAAWGGHRQPGARGRVLRRRGARAGRVVVVGGVGRGESGRRVVRGNEDRKSTRLNSSHVSISYAVFCLQK